MKLIYKTEKYKVYQTRILGYVCQIHETEKSGCLVRVPMGDTPKDKKMFDSLVYFNKSQYWAEGKEEARKKVFDFIKKHKK